MNNVSENIYPENTDDVLIKVAPNGNELYGDSLYRIGWFDGSWYVHGGQEIDVISWCEINLQK